MALFDDMDAVLGTWHVTEPPITIDTPVERLDNAPGEPEDNDEEGISFYEWIYTTILPAILSLNATKNVSQNILDSWLERKLHTSYSVMEFMTGRILLFLCNTRARSS